MCNLYSITTNQAAIIALFRVINRYVRDLPPMTGVFPDYPAPVIRNTDTGTEMVSMRSLQEPRIVPLVTCCSRHSAHSRACRLNSSGNLVTAASIVQSTRFNCRSRLKPLWMSPLSTSRSIASIVPYC